MKHIVKRGIPTQDGAGVRLTRVFSIRETALTDPFLMMDHFGSDNPDEYMKGFPWHPHRGIETVTHMLKGEVEHGDSVGNEGVIGPGDIQWMTAGGGVFHKEMPKLSPDGMRGLQLWVNLPAKSKMIAPRYNGILASEVPAVKVEGGEVKVIAGKFNGVQGPMKELIVDVQYLDVNLKKGASITHEAKEGYNSFCYCVTGSGKFDGEKLDKETLIIFNEAGQITVSAETDIRYIFVTGKRLNEPIAWGGPIVMNTQEELQKAFRELDEGTFIKK